MRFYGQDNLGRLDSKVTTDDTWAEAEVRRGFHLVKTFTSAAAGFLQLHGHWTGGEQPGAQSGFTAFLGGSELFAGCWRSDFICFPASLCWIRSGDLPLTLKLKLGGHFISDATRHQPPRLIVHIERAGWSRWPLWDNSAPVCLPFSICSTGSWQKSANPEW